MYSYQPCCGSPNNTYSVWLWVIIIIFIIFFLFNNSGNKNNFN